jgi:ferric-dicitrate binding protein FerR (iron transport regulator)
MSDQEVGVNESRHRRASARACRVLRRTSSHATPRLAAGTSTAPARSRRFGVLASMAPCCSTLNTIWSPSVMPSASRTSLGTAQVPSVE